MNFLTIIIFDDDYTSDVLFDTIPFKQSVPCDCTLSLLAVLKYVQRWAWPDTTPPNT